MCRSLHVEVRGAGPPLPRLLEALARSLAPQGRFVAVEPAATRHGPSVDELRGLIRQAGLVEVADRPIRGFGGAARQLSFRRS